MKLHKVLSVSRTAVAGAFDLDVVADLEDGMGQVTIPFTWHRADQNGLSPQVTEWMDVHPDLPVAEYVPPPAPPPPPAPTNQELVATFNDAVAQLKARGLLN